MKKQASKFFEMINSVGLDFEEKEGCKIEVFKSTLKFFEEYFEKSNDYTLIIKERRV